MVLNAKDQLHRGASGLRSALSAAAHKAKVLKTLILLSALVALFLVLSLMLVLAGQYMGELLSIWMRGNPSWIVTTYTA